MWTVTNYNLTEKDLQSFHIVTKIENNENTMINAIGLFINPVNIKHIIPFIHTDTKVEKAGSIMMMTDDSLICLSIKLNNKDDVSHIYDILKLMNEEYVTKKLEKEWEEYNKSEKKSFITPDCFLIFPILDDLEIHSDNHIQGIIRYHDCRKIQLVFEELSRHHLIDKTFFSQVYEDFSNKIQKCI